MTNEWKPIGNGPNDKFTGTFDGKNHYISGCYVSEANNSTAGLFGATDTIKNLTIKDSYIYSAKQNVGGIVGGIIGYAAEMSIEQCNNSGNIQSDAANVGGIAGSIQSNSKITSCNNTGEITSKGNYVGGILGNLGSACKVESCNNVGKIITRDYVAGGVVGIVNESDASETDSIVNKCYNSGTIEGGYIGGIVDAIKKKILEMLL